MIDSRGEKDKSYTIFSDSQAALSRIQHDRTSPGQALAIEAISTAEAVVRRGNIVSLRWTPSHEGVEGNERVDRMAKRAAEEEESRASPQFLREASLSHLTRVTTEARSAATAEWIRMRSGCQRRY